MTRLRIGLLGLILSAAIGLGQGLVRGDLAGFVTQLQENRHG